MTDSHLASVPRLIAEFPRWLSYFTEHVPFTKADQLALHRRAIDLCRSQKSVNVAIDDPAFLTALHGTLRAWGIGSRASRLLPFPEFGKAIRSARGSIVALEHLKIESPRLKIGETADRVWQVIQAISVADNDTQLVAGTKTLHHLLPDLVPPMDRGYTKPFFRWGNEFQYEQEQCFKLAFTALADVAQKVNPGQYVGSHPWNTSTTKVLDNALVGMVMASEGEVVAAKAPGPTAVKQC